jgi:hypothetical protein
VKLRDTLPALTELNLILDYIAAHSPPRLSFMPFAMLPAILPGCQGPRRRKALALHSHRDERLLAPRDSN